MRDDRLYLLDMLNSIQRIEEYTQPGEAVFKSTKLVQDAVIRNFEIIGESSRYVSEALRQQYPTLPWQQIAAFRNFLIHSYWNVDVDRVWVIIEQDLPPLKTQVETILQVLDDQNHESG